MLKIVMLWHNNTYSMYHLSKGTVIIKEIVESSQNIQVVWISSIKCINIACIITQYIYWTNLIKQLHFVKTAYRTYLFQYIKSWNYYTKNTNGDTSMSCKKTLNSWKTWKTWKINSYRLQPHHLLLTIYYNFLFLSC